MQLAYPKAKAGQGMRIQVDLTAEDLLTSHQRSKSRIAPSLFNIFIFGLLGFLVISAVGGLIASSVSAWEYLRDSIGGPPEEIVPALASAGLMILGGLVGPIIFSIIILIAVREKGQSSKGVVVKSVKEGFNTGATTYVIAPDSLMVRYPGIANVYSWRAVKEIEPTHKGLIIRMSDGAFHTVPNRAFDSESQKLLTVDTMRTYMLDAPLLTDRRSVDAPDVIFEPSDEDWKDINHHRDMAHYGVLFPFVWLFKSRLLQRSVVGLIIIMLAVAAYDYASTAETVSVGSIAVWILLLFVQPLTWRMIGAVVSFFKRDKRRQIYGESAVQSIALSEGGLITRTPTAMIRYDWRAVEKIIETKRALYFSFSDCHAVAAPKRAFADEEQFKRFASAAQSYQASAVGETAIRSEAKIQMCKDVETISPAVA
ncbi:MAG: YcxB family protein [Pseudomonadota bacterium]